MTEGKRCRKAVSRPGKRYKQATYEIGGRKYPAKHMITSPAAGKKVPMLEVELMSDIKWQRKSLEDRLLRPEIYEKYVGEDVPAVIRKLEKWLYENDPEYATWRKGLEG